jgi:predicted enzyme related to lactoylglutathione lyase
MAMLKHIKFAELAVEDQDRAVRFYTEKAGLRVAQDSPYQEGWRWIELEFPGSPTRILLTRREAGSTPKSPALVLAVEHVAAAHEALAGKGVEFTQKPTEASWNPGETYAVFRDSEGNNILIGPE